MSIINMAKNISVVHKYHVAIYKQGNMHKYLEEMRM